MAMGLARRFFKRMPLYLIGLIVIGVGYAFFMVFAWLAGDHLLFQPRPTSYVESLPGFFRIPTPDGASIAAVQLTNPRARFTILYFHGNAEDIGDLEPQFLALRDRGFSVVGLDYRGYGLSTGEPSEANAYADAATAFRYVTQDLGVRADRIILYGRSLGSGPTIDLATREPVAGLVVQSGFVSAFRTVTGIKLLPWDRFENLDQMPRVRCPVLVMHGDQDHTVPFSHGRSLFAAAPEPKQALWIEGARHNNLVDVAGERYWKALETFADSLSR